MIKVTDLHKTYNKNSAFPVKAVDGTSIEFGDKGLVAIYGRSGSGKTTFVNVIGGLDSFEEGIINIEGQEIKSYNPELWDNVRNKNIGYIFQNYNLIDNISIWDNIILSLNLAGITNQEEQKERTTEILKELGLFRFRKRRPTSLSGGQQQRVAIARALAKGPKILIADEPTGNLDRKNTIIVMELLKIIAKDRLVLLITHEPNIVKYYATRVVEISDGKVIKDEIQDPNKGKLSDDKVIYLGDMQEKNSVTEVVNLTSYTEGDVECRPQVTIIAKNDKFYLMSESDKVVFIDKNNTDIQIIKGESENDEIRIDTKKINIQPPKEVGKSYLVTTKQSIKNAFDRYNITKRDGKSKFGYVVLSIATIFIVLACALLSRFIVPNPTEHDLCDRNVQYVEMKNALFSRNAAIYNEIISKEGVVCYLPYLYNISATYYSKPYMQGTFKATMNTSFAPISGFDGKLIAGRMPADDNPFEIILDKKCYDNTKLLTREDFRSDEQTYTQPDPSSIGFMKVEDLIGEDFYFGNIPFTIVGICDTGYAQYYGDIDTMMFSRYNIIAEDKITKEAYIEKISDLQEDGTLLLNQDKLKEFTANCGPQLVDYDKSDNADFGFYVYVDDYDAFIESIKVFTTGDFVSTVYQSDYYDSLSEMRISNTKSIIILTAIILLITAIVLIYFIMRSNIFSRIREIGIYRAIGAHKRTIIAKFLFEVLVIMLYNTIIAFILSSTVLFFLSSTELGIILINYGIMTAIIAFLISFVITLFFGLLPIITLLRLTPAEILSKYDI